MGLDVLPQRSASQRNNEEWFNVFMRALSEDHVPRGSNGAPLDNFASLGSSNSRWLAAHLMGLYFGGTANKHASLTAPSGLAADYEIKMPTALPAANKTAVLYIDSTGASTLVTLDNALEVTSTLFRIKALGVAPTKLASIGVQTSNPGGITGANPSFTTLKDNTTTTLSVSVTTTGKNPVWIGLASQTGAASASVSPSGTLRIMRDATEIARYPIPSGLTLPPGAYYTLDFAPAGTYTYTVQAKDNGVSVAATNVYIVGFEMQ